MEWSSSFKSNHNWYCRRSSSIMRGIGRRPTVVARKIETRRGEWSYPGPTTVRLIRSDIRPTKDNLRPYELRQSYELRQYDIGTLSHYRGQSTTVRAICFDFPEDDLRPYDPPFMTRYRLMHPKQVHVGPISYRRSPGPVARWYGRGNPMPQCIFITMIYARRAYIS